MRKEDRLHPIVSLVLYYGEKPWDGPLSLKDMMLDMPDEISSIFSDYKMNLVQIHDGDKYHFSNPDVQNVFTMCNHFYKFEKDKLFGNYKDKKLSHDVLQTVAAITNSTKFLSMFTTEKKGGMSMCSALELWEQEARQQGEETGKQIGKQIGLQSGINAYIELCKDFNLSFNAVVSRLIDKFSLTESDANAYVTQFGY